MNEFTFPLILVAFFIFRGAFVALRSFAELLFAFFANAWAFVTNLVFHAVPDLFVRSLDMLRAPEVVLFVAATFTLVLHGVLMIRATRFTPSRTLAPKPPAKPNESSPAEPSSSESLATDRSPEASTNDTHTLAAAELLALVEKNHQTARTASRTPVSSVPEVGVPIGKYARNAGRG